MDNNLVHIEQLVSWVTPGGLSMSSCFMFYIRLHKMAMKSLHLSVV